LSQVLFPPPPPPQTFQRIFFFLLFGLPFLELHDHELSSFLGPLLSFEAVKLPLTFPPFFCLGPVTPSSWNVSLAPTQEVFFDALFRFPLPLYAVFPVAAFWFHQARNRFPFEEGRAFCWLPVAPLFVPLASVCHPHRKALKCRRREGSVLFLLPPPRFFWA